MALCEVPFTLGTFADGEEYVTLKFQNSRNPPSLGARINRILTMKLSDAPMRLIFHTAKWRSKEDPPLSLALLSIANLINVLGACAKAMVRRPFSQKFHNLGISHSQSFM